MYVKGHGLFWGSKHLDNLTRLALTSYNATILAPVSYSPNHNLSAPPGCAWAEAPFGHRLDPPAQALWCEQD